MTKKLLCCPFCGGEAICYEDEYGEWTVMCAEGSLGLVKHCPGRPSSPWTYDTEEEAIEAWNRRAERTCHNTQTDLDFMCSVCGKTVDNGGLFISYCPSCGAKVVGE